MDIATATPASKRPRTAKLSLDYVVLSGAQFDDAVSGRWNGGGDITPRWLESPTLKYYFPRGILMPSTDERAFFLALTAPSPTKRTPKPLKRAVGVLELEVNPSDDGEIWLKYITVDPQYQRQGIAKELLALMVSYLKQHPRLLSRSRSSEEGKAKVQAYISGLLDANALRWKQSD